jgi:hypothetical protein
MRSDTEQALKSFKVSVFGNKRQIEYIDGLLDNNEKVMYIAGTNAIIKTAGSRKSEKLPGVVALTTKRVIFYYAALTSHKLEMFSIPEIKTISCSGNGLTGGHILVDTITKSFDFLVSYKKDVIQKIQQIIYEIKSNYSTSASIAQPAGEAEQIEKMYSLVEKGILTKEEFEIKKRKILGL